MNIFDYTYILFIGSLSLLFLYGIKFLSNVIKIKKEELRLETSTNLINSDAENTVVSKLDTLIKNIFDDYVLFNISLNDNFLILEDTEKKITNEISTKVLESISDNLLQLLEIYYRKEKIADLITSKVYVLVFQFLLNYKK